LGRSAVSISISTAALGQTRTHAHGAVAKLQGNGDFREDIESAIAVVTPKIGAAESLESILKVEFSDCLSNSDPEQANHPLQFLPVYGCQGGRPLF